MKIKTCKEMFNMPKGSIGEVVEEVKNSAGDTTSVYIQFESRAHTVLCGFPNSHFDVVEEDNE